MPPLFSNIHFGMQEFGDLSPLTVTVRHSSLNVAKLIATISIKGTVSLSHAPKFGWIFTKTAAQRIAARFGVFLIVLGLCQLLVDSFFYLYDLEILDRSNKYILSLFYAVAVGESSSKTYF